MPAFYFNLSDGGPGVIDTEGADLRDENEAKAHAIRVARELMQPKDVNVWSP
jgi:hypothetical protein